MSGYYTPPGGLPAQTQLMTGRAVFTDAYAFIPKGCFSDIVTSALPGWHKTKLWMIARPMSGFSETFSQYVMAVSYTHLDVYKRQFYAWSGGCPMPSGKA